MPRGRLSQSGKGPLKRSLAPLAEVQLAETSDFESAERYPVKTFNCGICQGVRETNGTTCFGCGSEVEKCSAKEPSRKPTRCPTCQSHRNSEMEPGRFSCRDCGAVFEGQDFGFLDDRPHIALEKKERLAAATARGVRHRTRRRMV